MLRSLVWVEKPLPIINETYDARSKTGSEVFLLRSLTGMIVTRIENLCSHTKMSVDLFDGFRIAENSGGFDWFLHSSSAHLGECTKVSFRKTR